MRRFQVCTCGEPMTLSEAPTPQPKGTEVLLKVLAAGVCHSDLHLADGYFDLGGGKKLSLTDRGMKLPMTLGHENVGEVIAVGPDAKGVKVGQRRLVNPWIGCGKCAVCLRGDDNLCRAMRSLGVFINGGYATHMMVPHPRYLHDIGDLSPRTRRAARLFGRDHLWRVEESRDPEDRADGDHRRRRARPDVPGAASARWAATRPSSSTSTDAKRAAAKKAGAKATVNGEGRRRGAADHEADQRRGAWAVIDVVGSSASARMGYDSLVKGGKYIIVGLYGGDLTVSLPPIPMRAITIQGSYVGSQHEMQELMELVRAKGLPDVPVATRPLDDVNAVHGELRAGKVVGRVVLTPAA